MSDFLLELRSEEIPARMQAKARDDLARLFAAELTKAGITPGPITTYATPRRLALIARDLPDETAPVSEELKGPRVGAPAQALEGFLRKTGLAADQLIERDGVLFAVIERPGRRTADVLADALPGVVRAFPWPKSMRWGADSLSTESLRWVRPLQGIIALLDSLPVDFEVSGIASGRETVGHRFHSSGPISIDSAATYVAQLRAAQVIVDQEERAAIIRTRATALAADAGLTLIADEGLVAENAGLTEWPVPLLGRFDAAFLAVPPEVIQLTARVNQKYFVCAAADGTLANAFICTANIAAVDGGERIIEGNRKVLAARLSDAKFFYDTDLKVPLEDHAKKLDRIVFHEQLGTVADKVARVAKLAEWLATEGIVPGCDPALARRAAELCKADLVTGMVGEFPELQGVMGGYYAAEQGEHPAVAAAIRDHYKPVGQGDDVPTEPVTVAVSLADKLDTLSCFFATDERPTGSRDPFALRRSALGELALTLTNKLRCSKISVLRKVVSNAPIFGPDSDSFAAFDRIYGHGFAGDESADEAEAEDRRRIAAIADQVIEFLIDRLKVQQREAGVRHDLIDAVFALGGEDDLVRLLARVHALQSFVATEDGANLLAGYKRAANILKKETGGNISRNAASAMLLTESQPEADLSAPAGASAKTDPEPAEAALITALDTAEPAAAAAIEREDFAAAMAALATLRAPIDAFFDSVTVNDPDPATRAARLALLDRVRRAVHGVADFSKIEG